MKIAIVVHIFPAISETFILNHITGLIDLGHEVDVFAFRAPGENKRHQDVVKYSLLDRVFYFNIPQKRLTRIIHLLRIAIKYFFLHPKEILECLNFKEHGGKYASLNNLFKLEPFLKKRYELIHFHYGNVANRFIFIKNVWPKLKFVTTFHGYDITAIIEKRGFDIYKNLFNKGDIFLTVSDFFARKLENLGCPKQKIIVHHSGVDTETIEFKKDLFNDSKIRILTVGRLVEKKGLEYSISSVARVIKKYPNTEYYIIGDGLLREKLNNFVSELGMQESIKLIGYQDSDYIRKLMLDSDIFILSSITAENGDQEGIPVSIMEAMATGLPVISTYHSGIPELVKDGKSGLLVPEKSINAMAEKLENLIDHPELCSQMRKEGRKFVEENFDIKKQNIRLLEIYNN